MTSEPSRSAIPTSVSLTLAAVALGIALQFDNGFYNLPALLTLAVALILTVAGMMMMPGQSASSGGSRLAHLVMTVGIGVQLVILLTDPPGMYVGGEARVEVFKLGVVIEAVLVAAGACGLKRLARWWFLAVLAVNMGLGVWMLRASPDPAIDVVAVHRGALRALGRGRNPYSVTFRNIYDRESGFYNPQALMGDRVIIGYPYPPMSLLMAAPGQLIFRDYRYAQLAALVGAAALVGYGGVSLLARLAAVLLLTTPRVFFVLEQGWTEPVALLMLGATVWAMLRRPAWSPWLGGLFAVTKQYLGLAGPLLLKFGAGQPEGVLGFLGRSGLAASIVTLPFALWNLRAFLDNVVLLQTKEPFRTDSLSFVSWAVRAGWGEASFMWAVGAAVVALVLVLWRTPNTVAGFAGGTAFSAFAMFAMGSKAFCNYYFFVIGALCCALAALAAPVRDSSAA